MEQQAPFAVAVALRGPVKVLLLGALVAVFWLVLGAAPAQADEQEGRPDGHVLPGVARETGAKVLGDAKALADKPSGGATDVVMDEVETTVGEAEATVDETVRKVGEAAPPVGDVVRKVEDAERAVDHVAGLADGGVESEAPTPPSAPSDTDQRSESSTKQGDLRPAVSDNRSVRAGPAFAGQKRVDVGRAGPDKSRVGTDGDAAPAPALPVDGSGLPIAGLVPAATLASGSGGGSSPVVVALATAHTHGAQAQVLLSPAAAPWAIAGPSRSPGCTPD